MSELNASKQAKREIITQIKEKIENSQSFVIIDYKGLTVEQDTELRKNFRQNNVEYKVLKNTFMRHALNELGYTQFDEALNGPTAVAFGVTDAMAPAKIAVESVKKYEKIAIKCGMFDKAFIDDKMVAAYAAVPAKPVLLSMLLSVLQAPVRGLAVALNAVAEKQA